MRNRVLCLLALFAFTATTLAADSPIKITALTAEHQINPVGIGVTHPRLSWKLLSSRPGEIQTAYQIRAASSLDKLTDKPDLWDSAKVPSDQSVLIPWAGSPLGSRAQILWQVRVWDRDDKSTDWSAPASIELGLLTPASDFKGQWITVPLPRYDIVGPDLANATWITPGATAAQGLAARTTITIPADARVHSAGIAIAAEGLITLYVNGKPTRQGASSHTAPFYADFGYELLPGKNTVAIFSLAVRGAGRGGAPIGKNAIAAHATINLENGPPIDLLTTAAWKSAIAPADFAWVAPEFDDSSWSAASELGRYSTISPIRSADGTIGPGRYLRKTFTLKGPVAKARLYATALGVYEASINGKPVSDDQLAPGWTDYFKRVMVQTYDVTKLLTLNPPNSPNTLAALLGDGWFAGRLGWMGFEQYARVSDHPLFNAQLEITYTDGSTEIISTDNTWKGGPGEVVGSDQQLGEVLDARASVPFDQPTFDDSKWTSATVEPHPEIQLDPQLGPPVRKLLELAPKTITHTGGLWIIDFGQNMVGHIRLTATAPAGTTIRVLHGETINADGTVYNENLRQAISLDTFTFAGGAIPETFEPHFTFHGFRYAQISGPDNLTLDDIHGVVVGSDTPDTATFETSNPDINQLVSNIRWGQRGNFISVPTDCPQRDERMGWMGDAQVFAPTAALNADVAGFFTKWMVDIDDGQLSGGDNDGAYCVTSPRVSNPQAGYPIWGDAGVIIPWEMYRAYGDRGFLETNYPSMKRWIEFSRRRSQHFLQTGGVGDNLAPLGGRGGGTGRGGPGGPPATRPVAGGAAGGAVGAGGRGFGAFGGINSTTAVLDTAYFAHSAQILSKSAALLGKPDDAAEYDKLYHDIIDAFDKAYVHPDGSMVAGTQSTYVVALQFGLIPDTLRDAVVKHLTDDIQSKGHLSTGFVGVGLLNPALTAAGRSDLAYQLLLTDTYPSWLFTIRQGATTIWERWDGYTPEHGFQASSMNSFNHYSLGSIGKWLYSGAAGIDLDESHPGYKHFALNPQFSNRLGWIKASLDSPYGRIASAWRVDNGVVTYDATVPPNSTATLTLPAAGEQLHISGDPVTESAAVNGTSVISLPPGTYHFSLPLK